ncbi:MAG: DUF3320 domain-containing protein, partial [Lachnospiraceae bacterium]|nr:DUF3320 domain-containing protein [Lachnospiraceae bacterium]
VLTVLANESPISETLLTRRVVQSYSIARAGSRIQSFMSGIFKSMNLKYTTQGGERFFWKASQDPYTYAKKEYFLYGPFWYPKGRGCLYSVRSRVSG